MPLDERSADPLTELLAAFVRSIGIVVCAAAARVAAILRTRCVPRIPAANGVAPSPHVRRWLR
jgi:hypothetical protein